MLPARITCAPGVPFTPAEVADSQLFRDWHNGFEPGWTIEHVAIQAVVGQPPAFYMIFVEATATDPLGRSQTVSFMLRGRTVDILTIVTDDEDNEYVVFVEQPRVPAGRIVLSNPAGTVSESDISSAALRELAEEVGDDIHWGRPQWLSSIITRSHEPLLVSPGGSSEVADFCFVRVTLPSERIQSLRGRAAGLAEEGEHIRVHVVELVNALAYLSQYGHADLKAITSLLMYLHLSRP